MSNCINVFYYDCVITDTCTYTCILHSEGTDTMHTLIHMYTHPQTHAQLFELIRKFRNTSNSCETTVYSPGLLSQVVVRACSNFRNTSKSCETTLSTHKHVCIFKHTHTHTTMWKQDGHSPLYIASQEGHDRIVDLLLQAGATVDLQDKVENCFYLFICHLWCAMAVFIVH